jgi:hypothetical protein
MSRTTTRSKRAHKGNKTFD